MNFLALCQRLRLEAGISGTGPTSVIGQTGDYAKVVSWIQTAYEDIQSEHVDWEFLQTSFSFTTTSGTQEYSPASASITDHAAWKVSELGDMRVYLTVTDESWLDVMPWADFRLNYLYGSSRTTTGKPTVVSVKPDNALVFYPIPDDTYTINGEYFKTPDTLDANADTPVFPARFHMAIVWKALMYFGAKYAADESYQHGANEYGRLMSGLELDQLPQIGFGAPLA